MSASEEKKRERKILLSVACAGIQGQGTSRQGPGAALGESSLGALKHIPSSLDPLYSCPLHAYSHTSLSDLLVIPWLYQMHNSWLTRGPSWHGSRETNNSSQGAKSAAETEKSQTSNSQLTGQPDSRLHFPCDFLQIFVISLACWYYVALALDN